MSVGPAGPAGRQQVMCECGTQIWPGHLFGKWKLSGGGMFQRRECKNCGFTEERWVF
jgi:hypothetical protein